MKAKVVLSGKLRTFHVRIRNYGYSKVSYGHLYDANEIALNPSTVINLQGDVKTKSFTQLLALSDLSN